ncbi:Dihydrodipicolinate synthase/N-acetylneuraminate lyase [Pseudomonas syringae pv. actinidiae]|uniref:Dihydrodipicolinate synthase/N-acetylneuraminate lyase n=1 Tax=Pseudomonas syringae pv. actinidiae TaxID=103796 RepID=A0AAN4TM71_PSESF|nr:Dihydrodipicolinate synthase/N-acetylneuraminate lyase [Pseudomonas syringae pv. actinidiae]
MGLLKVLALNVRAQPIHRIVGNRHRFIDCVVGNQAQHRTKNLLSGDAHRRIHFRKNRWPRIKTLLMTLYTPRPTANQFCTLTDTRIDHRLHAMKLCLVGNRPQHRVFQLRITDDDRPGRLGSQCLDFCQTASRHNHARRCAA